MAVRVPLKERPLDLLYFSFFLMHIPASILIDFQALFYPATWIPLLPEWYITLSNDPLIGGMMRSEKHLAWFNWFLVLELLFQFPLFFIGARALWKGSKSIYIVLLGYGASTATSTLPCIAHVVCYRDTLSPEQIALLLSSYIPFFLIPLGMAVDMGFRLSHIVDASLTKPFKAE